MASKDYRFSFGPWNIHEGADPFGPTVRPTIAFAEKLKEYKKLGFEGVQFHDDDAVPDIDKKNASQVEKESKALGGVLKDQGLVPEFVAPRLWEDPRGVDGGYALKRDPREISLLELIEAVDGPLKPGPTTSAGMPEVTQKAIADALLSAAHSTH